VPDRPFVIGIGGPSGAGKSALARSLSRRLGSPPLLAFDDYYRDQSALPQEEREQINFDHPEAVEVPLLLQDLGRLLLGDPAFPPFYDFSTHTRSPGRRKVVPAAFLLVEGLHVLYWKELRALLDLKIYVHAREETCLQRRIERDQALRSRNPESIRRRFFENVLPMERQYVSPTRCLADLVIDGEDPLEDGTDSVLKLLPSLRP